jgi:hypothetical protein
VATDSTTHQDPTDLEIVTELLGRPPMGSFGVALRRHDGSPVVLVNEPLLDDGTPMPTRYWLCDRSLNRAIGRIESEGAVDEVEALLPAEEIAAIHDAYAVERDARIADDHDGPRPSGGVGGTRTGVKCLHAHYANLLVGNDDAIGVWTHHRLEAIGAAFDPAEPGIATTWPR